MEAIYLWYFPLAFAYKVTEEAGIETDLFWCEDPLNFVDLELGITIWDIPEEGECPCGETMFDRVGDFIYCQNCCKPIYQPM